MKPIILQGHTRPIKDIKFNKDGDLLFTCSLDKFVTLWASETGERIGTFEHAAAVNNMALTSDSKILISGDNLGDSYFWDVESGKLLKKMSNKDTVYMRSIDLSYGDEKLILTYSGRSKKETRSYLDIYKLSDILSSETNENQIIKSPSPFKTISSTKSNFSIGKWINLNKNIVCTRDDGYVELIDYETGNSLIEKPVHKNIIMDMDISKKEEIILTSGKDGRACVIDPDTLDVIHVLHPQKPTRNINSCKISPLFSIGDENEEKYHVILAGGQESRDVTTTDVKQGGFELLIYNAMYGEELGAIQGHFGPVNTIAFDPSGKIVASGAEDATIRVHKLDEDYFNLQ